MGGEAGQPDAAPWLPPGRYVWLPGRGRTFVRELAGPPGAPMLILLHGWTATADLNWFACFHPLAERFRVIAIDHRGHGRGLRSIEPFRLEHCADDVAALARELGIDRFVPVGYSMGGPIAQLVWQRHRELVDGLVLCATSAHVHRHDARAAALRRRCRHERRRRSRADRQADQRCPRPLERVAEPSWRVVVGVRPGRPPRLAPDRRGRAGDRSVRLACAGSATSPCHRRSWSPTTTTSCRCIASWRSPTGCVKRRSGASPAATPSAPVAPERFVPALVAACTAVAGRRSPIGVMALAA